MSIFRRLTMGAFLISTAVAFAASPAPLLRVKILTSESHQIDLGPDQGPRDCDLANYSGYCHGTRTQAIQNVMTVAGSDGKLFHVMCKVDTRWSKCVPVQVGATVDARSEKHGITIFFIDDNGKPRKQFYSFVAADKETRLPAAAAAATQSAASILQPAAGPARVIPNGN